MADFREEQVYEKVFINTKWGNLHGVVISETKPDYGQVLESSYRIGIQQGLPNGFWLSIRSGWVIRGLPGEILTSP